MGRKRKTAEKELADGKLVDSKTTVPALRLEWRTPTELAENPANWRRHPDAQLAALNDVIAEVGWAGACLFNEKTGRLIDGHARRTIALRQGAAAVPVLVGSWTEEQERKILATLDPIAGQAETDPAKLNELIASIETESDAVRALLESLRTEEEDEPAEPAEPDTSPQLEGLQYRVLVECSGEQQQGELIQRLEGEGFKCRPLMS